MKLKREKTNQEKHPNLSILRKVLFWDTDINKIDWQKQYKAVIERGNEVEKKRSVIFMAMKR